LRLTVLAPSRWIGGSTHLEQGAPVRGNLVIGTHLQSAVFLIPNP
jgi:hypothetical protein